MIKKKRVLFIHYRTGERDGVSLEIEKRAKILKELGVQVGYLTGFDGLARKIPYQIKEIDIRSNFSKFLRENCFYKKILAESFTIGLYHRWEAKIYQKGKDVFEAFRPDLVFVHNLFSHAYNLPATTALVKLLDKYQISTVAVHHDFWFERSQFLKPNYDFIREILDSLPPSRPYIIKHQVINFQAEKDLMKRRGIRPEVIGDYFDFSQVAPTVDKWNQDLKSFFGVKDDDLFILHATRISQRKAIENAIMFAKELETSLQKQTPIRINKRLFQKNSRAILFFPNFVETDALDYYKKIKSLAQKIKLKVIWAGEYFSTERREVNGVQKYCFWDSYVFADLVTYTSIQESFGNQFLEALFFKKIPVVFEYPVFKTDLKKEGYDYISLGDQVKVRNSLNWVDLAKIKKAVGETIAVLVDPKRQLKMINKNFQIGRRFHDERFLKEDLRQLLRN